jgi:hypothetical protein
MSWEWPLKGVLLLFVIYIWIMGYWREEISTCKIGYKYIKCRHLIYAWQHIYKHSLYLSICIKVENCFLEQIKRGFLGWITCLVSTTPFLMQVLITGCKKKKKKVGSRYLRSSCTSVNITKTPYHYIKTPVLNLDVSQIVRFFFFHQPHFGK